MLTVQEITYFHPDKELLFENISFSLKKQDKVALIGNNGAGKSTLLKVIAGILPPAKGVIRSESKPYYIPQHFGQYNNISVAQALQIDNKLNALHAILQGDVSDKNLAQLNDDWTIEERSIAALTYWNLSDLPLTQKMDQLSGGEKTKVFLAGILIHQPEIVLLDEPTNHLDTHSRQVLYNFITTFSNSLIVVSHDRVLLELLNSIYELDKHGITVYGGNYSFYKEQKGIAENALFQQLEEKEKALRKAKKAERESLERKQRQDVRGKGKHEKEGVARIFMKTLKNNAELSSAKLKDVHSEKIESISSELKQVHQKLPDSRKMKMNFQNSSLHTGKILITAQDINFGYSNKTLWNKGLNFQIRSGERICIKGKNGSGKTTLIRILLGEIVPACGVLSRAEIKSVYIDQDYSLISDKLTVYEQAQQYNYDALPEYEVKIRLNRYLFSKDFWDKPCNKLSGGEKMRLVLCCLMIGNHAPDLFVLDEPTNNLDIQSIEILTSAINEYTGTLLVVSHDNYFLNEVNVNQTLEIE
ncbi:MAG: ABC-F family ATP-binding cassette domain-containing protein [Bacteroidota bacterium]|nr:ABC-F family ATP-binding cassette domain-containing protein [Bacteroidota bacterium]